jgi:hypothetical protein
MKRFVTLADVLALAVPAAAAIVGTWHLVYNHLGNPLGRTSAEIALLYALYAGGYVFWGSIARGVGAASVAAATATLFVLGMFFSISAAIGPLLVPAIAVPSLGGLVAAGVWGSRRAVERPGMVPRDRRQPATSADAAAIVLTGIFAAATAIVGIASDGAPAVALRPWAVVLEYIAFLGGYGFLRLQPRGAASRVFVPAAFMATLGILFGASWDLGVLILLFVAAPATGGAMGSIVAMTEPPAVAGSSHPEVE